MGLKLFTAAALALSACGGDGATPDLGTEALIGMQFVEKRGCAKCHQSPSGADGVLSGQSTPVAGSEAYAGNLTQDRLTGLGAWADIEILRAIRYGVDNQELPLCPTMPRFDGSDPTQPFMSDVEANAIVAYLRTLPPVERIIPPSMCPPLKPPPPLDLSIAAPVDLESGHD